MKKKQSDKDGMFAIMKKTLTGTPADVIAEMPGAAELIVEFCSALVRLGKYSSEQSRIISGYSERKTALKVLMIRGMLSICNCVKGYAMNNKQTVLYSEMDKSFKYLQSFINKSNSIIV